MFPNYFFVAWRFYSTGIKCYCLIKKSLVVTPYCTSTNPLVCDHLLSKHSIGYIPAHLLSTCAYAKSVPKSGFIYFSTVELFADLNFSYYFIVFVSKLITENWLFSCCFANFPFLRFLMELFLFLFRSWTRTKRNVASSNRKLKHRTYYSLIARLSRPCG